jgi:hypothetical protein
MAWEPALPPPPPPLLLLLPQAATPVVNAASNEAETIHFARKIAPPLGKTLKRRAAYPTLWTEAITHARVNKRLKGLSHLAS